MQADWRPVLPPPLARRAEEVATELARRITTAGAAGVPPRSLARGDAGLAVLAGQMDTCRPGSGWDSVAHTFVSAAARDAERSAPGPGLFQGLAGIGFAAGCLSRGGARYARLLDAVDRALVAAVLSCPRLPADGTPGMPVSRFDLVSGLSGIGAYLIRRAADPSCRKALEVVLRDLVVLSAPADPPRWWTPGHLLATAAARRRYPAGSLNCGLAHGIPGPLAVLALAEAGGVTVPGQATALRRLADWLLSHRIEDRWGPGWPDVVAREGAPGPASTAWCYGGPGVARSLWLAGVALDDPDLRSAAVTAMAAACARHTHTTGYGGSPMFCHGTAGILHVTLRFAHDTGLPCFTEAAIGMSEEVTARYSARNPYGFTGLHDDPRGLLEGAAGIALTLLAAATDPPPAWDRAFLLA